MKVLIIGATGDLGKLLTKHLVSQKIEVIGIGRRETPPVQESDFFSYHRISITEKENLFSLFSRERPTHVVHFACTLNRVRDRQLEYQIDIGGSANILEACDQTPSVKSLIYSSSAAAYGGHEDNPAWLKETDPLRPEEYRYGKNKKQVEEMFLNARIRDDLRVTCLRICTVVGPFWHRPLCVVSLLIKLPFLPHFCANNRVQFLHSDDFQALMEKILKDDEIRGVFNMSPDDFALVRDLVPEKRFIWLPLSLLKGILWVAWNTRIMNLEPAGVMDSIYPITLDPSRLKDRYQYKFRYSTREAFQLTAERNEIPETAWF